MNRIVALLFVCACGGPSQSQLAETPSARAPARPAEAPPASTSDKDRERSVQQFEDMETTQRAYREAEGARQAPPRGAPPPPAKQGPAEQAPAPKKKGPAEQAPPGATP
jgi:hypothetical protein